MNPLNSRAGFEPRRLLNFAKGMLAPFGNPINIVPAPRGGANRMMTEPNSPSRAKVTRFGLLLAGAVIAYIVAVIVFIIVN
jgi:hypothetical protein